MAEPTQLEPSPVTANAVLTSPTVIKQEAMNFDGLELPQSLLDAVSKRPFEHTDEENHESGPKRVKTESQHPNSSEAPEDGLAAETEPGATNGEHLEDTSVEDGLALLIQNTLADISDLVGQSAGPSEAHEADGTAMDIDMTEPPEAGPEPEPVPPVTFDAEPVRYIRRANVNALGNMAISILLILAQRPFDETSNMLQDPESEHTQSLRRLRDAFVALRGLYAHEHALQADPLDYPDSDTQTVFQMANLAKLGSWLLDADSHAIAEAEEHVLALLPSRLSDMPNSASELYVAIKTQRVFEALSTKADEKNTEEIITETFQRGIAAALEQKETDDDMGIAVQLTKDSLRSREDALISEAVAQSSLDDLRQRYPSTEMLRHFCSYVRELLQSVTHLGDKLGLTIYIPEEVVSADTDHSMLDLDDLSSFFEKTTSGLVQNALAGLTEEDTEPVPTVEAEDRSAEAALEAAVGAEDAAEQTNGKIDFLTDYKELEALVAESTSNYVKTTLNGLSPVPYQPTVPASTAETMATQSQSPYMNQLHQYQPQNTDNFTYPQQPAPVQQPQQVSTGGHLPPNQTCTSAMLYDKARQAALSKSTAHTRREGLHSTRRPWTQEEEKALMAGLDMVKGPHWSQILTLFGQSGTISDILKDRTQVQLKDKARNLKLFFLKTNSEMPYYLQAVTGELKTRAPTQAARKEAEERARMNSDEDQAKVQGIMALAGGLQHPVGRISASPVSAAANPGAPMATPQLSNGTATSSGPALAAAPRTNIQPASAMPQTPAAAAALAAANIPRPQGSSIMNQPPGHQALQSAPPRPQGQLPGHVPRPQGPTQHQQQLIQQLQQKQQQQARQQQQNQQNQPNNHQPRPYGQSTGPHQTHSAPKPATMAAAALSASQSSSTSSGPQYSPAVAAAFARSKQLAATNGLSHAAEVARAAQMRHSSLASAASQGHLSLGAQTLAKLGQSTPLGQAQKTPQTPGQTSGQTQDPTQGQPQPQGQSRPQVQQAQTHQQQASPQDQQPVQQPPARQPSQQPPQQSQQAPQQAQTQAQHPQAQQQAQPQPQQSQAQQHAQIQPQQPVAQQQPAAAVRPAQQAVSGQNGHPTPPTASAQASPQPQQSQPSPQAGQPSSTVETHRSSQPLQQSPQPPAQQASAQPDRHTQQTQGFQEAQKAQQAEQPHASLQGRQMHQHEQTLKPQHVSPTPAPAPAPAHVSHEAEAGVEAQHDDNSVEADLIKGLQAAAAEATSQ